MDADGARSRAEAAGRGHGLLPTRGLRPSEADVARSRSKQLYEGVSGDKEHTAGATLNFAANADNKVMLTGRVLGRSCFGYKETVSDATRSLR